MTENKGTDWMYNPVSEINHEEYLLGKKVGKNFDADGTMGKINDVSINFISSFFIFPIISSSGGVRLYPWQYFR